jgi:hypothetical protein
MGLEITGGVPCSGFYLVWVLLSGLPFLLRPLAWAERRFRPKMTLISQHGKRAWVHLPWQPTTDLTPSRVCLFWQNVNASTCQALETHRTVIISSHLLTGIRARRLLATPRNMDSRSAAVFIRFLYSWKRALMQLEILFRQWRWRTDFRRDWPVLVLRRKSLNTEK